MRLLFPSLLSLIVPASLYGDLLCIGSMSVNAFSVSLQARGGGGGRSTATTAAARRRALFSSAPSDSASSDDDYSKYGYGSVGSSSADDDVVTIDSDEYTPTTEESMVSSILDMMPTSNFADSSTNKEQRAKINEALFKLEALNPTKSPALSPLLNSIWELRYVGGYDSNWALPSPTRQLALFLYSGGYSPGVFAYTLAQQLPRQLVDLSGGGIEITISRSQPRVQARVHARLFGGAIDSAVTVTARLEAESDLRLRETYESARVVGSGAPVAIPTPFQYARDLYVTYLDDDLLVIRDGSGVPEVLVRKEKQFQRNWGVEPSALDDMTPPGDGEDAKF
jgi:hypothetical protein